MMMAMVLKMKAEATPVDAKQADTFNGSQLNPASACSSSSSDSLSSSG